MEKVFIIEDSKVQKNRLAKLLEQYGCEVVGWARSGREAIKKISELRPNLVFVDVIIEGDIDGIVASEEIKKRFDIPVIFTTNYAKREYVDRALKASPYAYMLKPIDEDQLRVTLETTRNLVALEREKQKLTEALHQSQKMEAIGRLAGGIAHNFNNILSVMIGSAETALKNMADDDPNVVRIRRIIKSGLGARELTMKMLALTRREKTGYCAVSARAAVENVCDVLKESISKNIEIKTDIPGRVGKIRGDQNEVMQALLNVCINACDSMESGGALTIGARGVELDDKAVLIAPGLKPGKYCRITVQDTGCGMTEDVKNRIFEPFFTTKEKEKGTGLGMYVTLGIVQSHGGHIEVGGGPGKGTIVDIYFPVFQGDDEQEEKPVELKPADSAVETILIVDDEADFVDTMSEMLELEGYKTITVEDGAGAVETFGRRHNSIDLVLLDIMMPGMQGDDVYRKLRSIDPEAKIVLCSGFSVEGKINSLMNEGAKAFIQKPFEFRELRNTITQVLSV